MSDEKEPTTKKEKYSHLAASKSQEKTDSKGAKRKLITDEDEQIEVETNTHADTDTNQDADEPTYVIAKPEKPKDNVIQLFNDPATELIEVVASGKKKKKLEEERVRSTYWLLKEERSKINEMSKKTGYTKYDIVGMAIRSLHERIIQAQPEKKTKKKPDQQ